MDSGFLTLSQKLGFGFGCFLNNLTSTMWFTYLLLFYQEVLSMDTKAAGFILLVGQVANGVSTTVVGVLLDRPTSFWLCVKFGRKKTWHMLGTLCVLLTFPFMFLPCVGCSGSPLWVQLLYYCTLAVIFQFGWAALQISHLALIPSLSSDEGQRRGLTSVRFAMILVTNITVYGVTWAFFGVDSNQRIGPQDYTKFRNIVIIVWVLGAITSFIFHLSVTDKDDYEALDDQVTSNVSLLITPKDWMLEPHFYQVAGIYMFSRLFINISQEYIPLYLQESLQEQSSYVAIIPLVMLLAGFPYTLLNTIFDVKKVAGGSEYYFGSAIGLGSAIWLYYGEGIFFSSVGIFFCTTMYGVARSCLFICHISFINDLIGNHLESAAFVFGIMSFSDKILNGLVAMLIQNLVPCKHLEACPSNRWYYRDITFYVTGASAVLGSLFVLTLLPNRVGSRRKQGTDKITAMDQITLMDERKFLSSKNGSNRK